MSYAGYGVCEFCGQPRGLLHDLVCMDVATLPRCPECQAIAPYHELLCPQTASPGARGRLQELAEAFDPPPPPSLTSKGKKKRIVK